MQPLKFKALIKRARWGGSRLGDVLGKQTGSLTDAAESWELCDHGAEQTVVDGGSYSGWSLQRLVQERQTELFGRHVGQESFPLLLKFLDVQDRLSLQVHPNDEQARQLVPRQRGKTEAWIILSAEPNSYVFAGLARGVTQSQLRAALHSDDVEKCLHQVSVRAGDVLFIPAGTVHALGPGLLVAEVQQTSNLTYRLWDWGRLDAEGRPRDLHVEQALGCVDFACGPRHVQAPRALRHGPPHCEEALVESAWFIMHRHTASQRFCLRCDGRFRVLMVLEGQATLRCPGQEMSLQRGDTVLVPAAADERAVEPKGSVTLLEVFLP